MRQAKARGDICYPRFTIKGVDYWNEFFQPGTIENSKVNTAADMVFDHRPVKEQDLNWNQQENFQIHSKIRERAKELAKDTEIGVHIRETDKHDVPEVAFPSSLYIAEVKKIEGRVFCCSDCKHTIDLIIDECPNAWRLPDVYRSEFFPLHKSDIDELSSTKDLLNELSILLEMKKVLYGTYSGIISYLRASNIPIENLRKAQPPEIQEIISYYGWREKNLWDIK